MFVHLFSLSFTTTQFIHFLKHIPNTMKQTNGTKWCLCFCFTLRMHLWMNAYWHPCVGVWYHRGSRRTTRARCNIVPATVAVRIYWRRSHTRCTELWKAIRYFLYFWVFSHRTFLPTVFSPKDPMLKGQRCVILADGFYEWQRVEKGKQPFFIYFPQGSSQEKKGQDDLVTPARNKEKVVCPPEETSPGWSQVCIDFFFSI